MTDNVPLIALFGGKTQLLLSQAQTSGGWRDDGQDNYRRISQAISRQNRLNGSGIW